MAEQTINNQTANETAVSEENSPLLVVKDLKQYSLVGLFTAGNLASLGRMLITS